MSSGTLRDTALSDRLGRYHARGDRPGILPCILAYAGVACLAILATQVLAGIWGWSDPVRVWVSAAAGGVAAPVGAVTLVRSRWKVCGPEIAIVALTLAGLAVGVQLGAMVR